MKPDKHFDIVLITCMPVSITLQKRLGIARLELDPNAEHAHCAECHTCVYIGLRQLAHAASHPQHRIVCIECAAQLMRGAEVVLGHLGDTGNTIVTSDGKVFKPKP